MDTGLKLGLGHPTGPFKFTDYFDGIPLITLVFEKHNRIAGFIFNRQDSYNALNFEMAEGLERVIDHPENSKDTGVLIITGAGQKAFISGTDLK